MVELFIKLDTPEEIEVETSYDDWYLPSIQEAQDIITGGSDLESIITDYVQNSFMITSQDALNPTQVSVVHQDYSNAYVTSINKSASNPSDVFIVRKDSDTSFNVGDLALGGVVGYVGSDYSLILSNGKVITNIWSNITDTNVIGNDTDDGLINSQKITEQTGHTTSLAQDALDYVSTTTEITYNNYKKADLYKDETIQLTDTIQDVKDIAKVFTPFTQAFKLPASATNNKLFKHYYNADIDGFDARYRTDAIIKVDGVDYRKGKIALNKVDLKDGQAVSYDVNFFGNTVTLTEILGEDELKDLGTLSDGSDNPALSSLDFTYSASYVKTGFDIGYENESLIFPFISAKNYYYYDSASSAFSFELPDGAESRNVFDDGVHYLDLKPALKVTKVLQAIEEKYNISFSSDFFIDTDLTQLYLWLHREKGSFDNQLSVIESEDIFLSDFDYSSGDEVRTINNNYLDIRVDGFANKATAGISFTSNTPDLGSYSIELYVTILDNNLVERSANTLVKEEVNLTGSHSFSFEEDTSYFADIAGLNIFQVDYVKFKIKIKSFTNTQFSLSNIVLKSGILSIDTGNYTYNSGNNNPLSGKVSTLAGQLPKMKTIDFLKSLFKMFNLTTYFNGSQLVVQTLDDYYASGNTYDITKYIDASNHTVSRSNIYRNVAFEFPESKTFAAYNSNLLTGNEFGNLDFEDRDIDGGKYEVKVDFEKMQYERMSNQENGTPTGFQWGWFCDENKNTYINKPLLFYVEKPAAITPFFDGSTVTNTTTGYFMPANVKADAQQTLNFGSEFNEFTRTENTNSLFANYYSNYINDVFNKKARIYKFTAYLPSHIVNRYELNDTFIIAGREYIINSIKINLLNNKAELELLNKLS